MEQKIFEAYEEWKEKAKADPDLGEELAKIDDSEEEISDRFYRDLEFGTAGLRGVIGAGTNRMNVYTVMRASRALARYVEGHFDPEKRSIAVSYDSRIKSELFAKCAASVFASMGIKTLMYDRLMPVPLLSFAVRHLGCAAGVMITASHNPSQYNGYKVYNSAGCQITGYEADAILAEMEKTGCFEEAGIPSFEELLDSGRVEYIGEDTVSAYISCVKAQSLLEGTAVPKDVAIVYTPLNGTGLAPVTRTLTEEGYTSISVVPSQKDPDGSFPTCPYPNPEIREAMEEGIKEAVRTGADLLVATDPDCDRVGIAVKDGRGEYVLLSGNETGILLTDYICSRLSEEGKMPRDPVIVKTIVTTDMTSRIASSYGVCVRDVLTGFKYIGETIGDLEKEGKEKNFLFGYEESYGYLCGTYVRDKDAVVASLMICDMFCWWKHHGKSLPERLEELYAEYGYTLNTLYSFSFPGESGFERMNEIMRSLRGEMSVIGDIKITGKTDYLDGIGTLPISDVMKYELEGGSSVIIRPSGTEPKIKAYISVCCPDRMTASETEKRISAAVKELIS